MATPVTLISQMRRIVKVDTNQYEDSEALADLNTLKDEFWSWIVTKVQDKYNWEKWSTDSIALQSEYTIPTVASTTAWAKLLNWVSIVYNTSENTYTDTWWLKYIPAVEVNPNWLEYDWDYYVENQSEDTPIYYVADNSVFIAPAPRTWITNWIKLTWIRKIADYTLATTEAEMKLPKDQQNALLYGLIMFGYMNKPADDWTINNAEARWLRKRDEAIRSLEIRVDTPTILKYPEEQENILLT